MPRNGGDTVWDLVMRGFWRAAAVLRASLLYL